MNNGIHITYNDDLDRDECNNDQFHTMGRRLLHIAESMSARNVRGSLWTHLSQELSQHGLHLIMVRQ